MSPFETEETGQEFHFAELPDLSELAISRPLAAEARALLIELDSVQDAIKIQAERAEEIKAELVLVQQKAESEGLRHGKLCFAARHMPGQRRLNAKKLMENGVPRAIINDSMVQGKPQVRREFRHLE